MKRVLIMEDSISLALDWKAAFELNGFDVTLCFDGDSAAEHLKQTTFDLVVTDMFVNEGRGGLHVIGKLIAMKKDAPPVIAVTGARKLESHPSVSTNYFLEQAHRLGATASIEKPFAAGELVLAAECLLS